MTRLIGISDIHGEFDKLCAVLDKISPQKEDTIVFMGDYIDRGKKSRQVVDKIIDMQNVCNCVYLIGSHEYAMLHAKLDDYYNYLFFNSYIFYFYNRSLYLIFLLFLSILV